MKSQYWCIARGVLGLIMRAAGTSILSTGSDLAANIQSVKDQAQYDRYRGAVAGTQAPYDGKFLVRGAMPVMLGNSPIPQGTVVIAAEGLPWS